jgi:hypothetical protein
MGVHSDGLLVSLEKIRSFQGMEELPKKKVEIFRVSGPSRNSHVGSFRTPAGHHLDP